MSFSTWLKKHLKRPLDRFQLVGFGALSAVLAVLLLWGSNIGPASELRALGWRFRLRPSPDGAPPVTVVKLRSVGDGCIEQSLRGEVANFLEDVADLKEGPRLILVDVLLVQEDCLSEEGRNPADRIIQTAHNLGTVVLPLALTFSQDEMALPNGLAGLEKFSLQGSFLTARTPQAVNVITANHAIADSLYGSAMNVGFVSVSPRQKRGTTLDAIHPIIRWTPPATIPKNDRAAEWHFATLALAGYASYMGDAARISITDRVLRVEGRVAREFPLDASGRLWINYRNRYGNVNEGDDTGHTHNPVIVTYRRPIPEETVEEKTAQDDRHESARSVDTALHSAERRNSSEKSETRAKRPPKDALHSMDGRQTLPLEHLNNKLVLLVDGQEKSEVHSPLGSEIPQWSVHAQILSNLLENDFLKPLSWVEELLITLILAFIALSARLLLLEKYYQMPKWLPGPLQRLWAIFRIIPELCLIIAWLVMSWLAFVFWTWWLPVALPVGALVAVFIAWQVALPGYIRSQLAHREMLIEKMEADKHRLRESMDGLEADRIRLQTILSAMDMDSEAHSREIEEVRLERDELRRDIQRKEEELEAMQRLRAELVSRLQGAELESTEHSRDAQRLLEELADVQKQYEELRQSLTRVREWLAIEERVLLEQEQNPPTPPDPAARAKTQADLLALDDQIRAKSEGEPLQEEVTVLAESATKFDNLKAIDRDLDRGKQFIVNVLSPRSTKRGSNEIRNHPRSIRANQVAHEETRQKSQLITADGRMIELVGRLTTKYAIDDAPFLLAGEHGLPRRRLAKSCHVASARNGEFFPQNVKHLSHLDSRIDAFLTPWDAESLATGNGVFSEAEGGTLFIDRVEQLASTDQERLALLMRRWSVANTDGSASVRVILGTTLHPTHFARKCHSDLVDLIGDRQEWILPLRERWGDIRLMIQKIVSNMRTAKKTLTPSDEDHLCSHALPHNDLQLKRLVRGYAQANSQAEAEREEDTDGGYTSAQQEWLKKLRRNGFSATRCANDRQGPGGNRATWNRYKEIVLCQSLLLNGRDIDRSCNKLTSGVPECREDVKDKMTKYLQTLRSRVDNSGTQATIGELKKSFGSIGEPIFEVVRLLGQEKMREEP